MARQRRRGGWLSSLLGDRPDPPGTSYELAVLEGADAGASWTIDRPSIQIGRHIPGTPSGGGIELNDRSVSARHALLSCEDGGVHLEHLPSATNPTLVNGRRIKRRRIRDGDRIALGLVVLELRAHYPEAPAASFAAASPTPPPSRVETDPMNVQGELVLREGADELLGARFPLARRRTSIGRDEDCDIVIDLTSVSRNHAALVWEDDHLVLVHESSVNPTQVNGMRIHDRRRVFHGDEIRISERIAFEVVLQQSEAPVSEQRPTTDAEETRLTAPPFASGPDDDAEATRISTSAVSEPAARPDDSEATRIEGPVAPGGPPPEAEAPPPPVASFADAEATRIAPVPGAGPESAETPEPGATRVMTAPEVPPADPDRYRDAEATRIAPVPGGGPDSAETPEPGATRVMTAPEVPPADPDRYRDAEATRIAPAPGGTPDRYADAAATRIAPPPDAAPAPDAGADRTLVQPAPVAERETPPPAERTRVVDLDPELQRDEARTVVRPSPLSDSERTVVRPRPGGEDATVVRPRSSPPPAETVVLDGPEDEDREGDDEPGS